MKRAFTPDRQEATEDGRTRTVVVMKRACNGCGALVGDVTGEEMDRAIAGLPSEDVRAECSRCAPLVELERAGCATWRLTPRDYAVIDRQLDRMNVFAKAHTELVGGKLATVGMRVGIKPRHVVAFWGDWIVRHPDGLFTVHRAPGAVSA